MKLVSDIVSLYMTDLHHPLSDMNTFIMANMDAFECIATKLDVREFSSQNVPEEIKSKILEAARLTGSGLNTQHWRFIVVEEKNLL